MKSIKLILCLMLSFIFSQGALDQYDIPEYEYKTFQLSGNDLFNMSSTGDASEMSINVGADYMSQSQRPGYNLMYGVDFDFMMDSEDDGVNDAVDTSDWTLDMPFAVSQYFGGTKGAFGFADGNLSMFGGDAAEGVDDTSDLWLTLGAGYGRIVSARPVAQAYAIADALGIDADDDTILAIASVIGAASSYGSIYKDDAMQQYYNDLAEAAGVDGAAMQIQKVLTSPAYNVSDRFTGCEVKAGLYDNYMKADGDESKGDLLMEAGYAMPMGMDSQLLVGASYAMNLEEDGPTMMGLGATYTMDHSYNWATSAGFEYDSYTVGGEAAGSDMALTVSSSYAVLNQMSVTASFEYLIPDDGNDDTDDDATMNLSAKVTYWVF